MEAWLNPLSANPTKWSNTLKQNHRQQPTNCLSVLDHFVELALKGLTKKVCSTAIVVKHVGKYFINSITFFRSFAYF